MPAGAVAWNLTPAGCSGEGSADVLRPSESYVVEQVAIVASSQRHSKRDLQADSMTPAAQR